MKDGKSIELDNVASYFGRFSLRVESQVGRYAILAELECHSDRSPRRAQIRLPHPDGAKALSVSAGRYDPAIETVTVELPNGRAEVVVKFLMRPGEGEISPMFRDFGLIISDEPG